MSPDEIDLEIITEPNVEIFPVDLARLGGWSRETLELAERYGQFVPRKEKG